jgi:predicted nucleic acid-binding protein
LNVLVDTAVWSVALRRDDRNLNPQQHRVLTSLQELILKNQAELLAPVRQELLSGIREPLQFERVRRALRAYPDIPLATEDFEEAARMSNVCRAKGIAGSGVDHLICATAARREWSIFTLDQDFAQYARVLPIKLHKVK